MNRNEKLAWKDEVIQRVDKSAALFLANYTGMTVEELSLFRKELRSVNAEFKIVKNTIAKKAFTDRKEDKLFALLKGQVGTVYAYGDVAATAKVVSENQKKCERFKVLGGFLENAVLSSKDVESLSQLPSREVLISKNIGSLVSPHRQLVGVLQALPRNMVNVLHQIKETKTA